MNKYIHCGLAVILVAFLLQNLLYADYDKYLQFERSMKHARDRYSGFQLDVFTTRIASSGTERSVVFSHKRHVVLGNRFLCHQKAISNPKQDLPSWLKSYELSRDYEDIWFGNGDYIATMQKRADGSFVLRDVEGFSFWIIEQSTDHLRFCPPVSEWIENENAEFVSFEDDEAGRVRLNVIRRFNNPDRVAQSSYWFDDKHGGCVEALTTRELKLQGSGGRIRSDIRKFRTQIEYELVSGHLQPSKMVYTVEGDNVLIRDDSTFAFDFSTKLDVAQTYLKYYGLPEPPNYRHRGVPWRWVCIGVGLLCLAFGSWRRWENGK